MRYPFLLPKPAPLSERTAELRTIEESHRFTNFGPVNGRFEREVVERLFGGIGSAVTTANATLGLMLAIRRAVDAAWSDDSRRRFAVMPSFTFAATAQAALWCGLRPLFCDVERDTWLPDQSSIEELIAARGGEIAVIVPYATFGNNLDLAWYETLTARTGIPVVVDAAASLGSRTSGGEQFGRGFRQLVVYSMHATKTFAAAEGGLVYSGDGAAVAEVRRMSNFGFDDSRESTTIGLNAKLSEHGALLCLEKLQVIDAVLERRRELHDAYAASLRQVAGQALSGAPAFQFFPALVNAPDAPRRDRLIALAAREGVELRKYFSPPLHEQDFFRRRSDAGPLPVTAELSARVVSLPMSDGMTAADARAVAGVFNAAFDEVEGSA